MARSSSPRKKELSPNNREIRSRPINFETPMPVIHCTDDNDHSACEVCSEPIEENTPTLQCKECSKVYHPKCLNVPTTNKKQFKDWICPSVHEVKSKVIKEAIPTPTMREVEDYEGDTPKDMKRPKAYIVHKHATMEDLNKKVEYSMEDDDMEFRESLNAKRQKRERKISKEDFETIIDALEKLCFKLSKSMTLDDIIQAEKKKRNYFAEDVPCSVCGDSGFDQDDPMYICDGCDLTVHQSCYGISGHDDEWQCTLCSHEDAADAKCELCGHANGAMKPTTKKHKYAHLVCGLWTSGLTILNPKKMEPIDGISKLPKQKLKEICILCKKPGSCVRCKEKGCSATYHPYCAIKFKLYLVIRTSRGKRENVLFETFCQDHSEEHFLETLRKQKLPPSATPSYLVTTRVAAAKIADTFKDRFEFNSGILDETCRYWLQKKKTQIRPLLRSLQELSQDSQDDNDSSTFKLKSHDDLESWQEMLKIRRNLEKARILLDQIKRREELKKEIVQNLTEDFNFQLEKLDPLPTFKLKKSRKVENFPENSETSEDENPKKKQRQEKKKKDKKSNSTFKLKSQVENHISYDTHCHHCKKRRPKCASCPINKTHRFCTTCISRHFPENSEEIIENSKKAWADGCPKCNNECPCSSCQHGPPTSPKRSKNFKLKVESQVEDSENSENSENSDSENSEAELASDMEIEIQDEDQVEDSQSSQEDSQSSQDDSHDSQIQDEIVLKKSKSKTNSKEISETPIRNSAKSPTRSSAKSPVRIPNSGKLGKTRDASPSSKQQADLIEIFCQVCHQNDHEKKLVHCDRCDRSDGACHLYCMDPPLDKHPKKGWICSHCEKSNKTSKEHSKKKSMRPD